MEESSKTNLTALADAYAEAKRELSDLEVRVADLRRQILDTKYNSIPGTRCKVTVEHQSVRRLSADLVVARLGVEGFENCKKTSLLQIVRVKAR